MLSGVPRGGQRGRFAQGGTLRGAAKKGKEKKEKKEKRKKGEKEKKREKETIGEACNFNKTIKCSILAAAPRIGHVVKLIIRAFAWAQNCIGPHTFWRLY